MMWWVHWFTTTNLAFSLDPTAVNQILPWTRRGRTHRRRLRIKSERVAYFGLTGNARATQILIGLQRDPYWCRYSTCHVRTRCWYMYTGSERVRKFNPSIAAVWVTCNPSLTLLSPAGAMAASPALRTSGFSYIMLCLATVEDDKGSLQRTSYSLEGVHQQVYPDPLYSPLLWIISIQISR